MFKVLIVDDEPNMLAGLRRTLFVQSAQWEIRLAKDAREALDLLRDEHADLVITDMRMPGMNGAAFLAQVKDDYPFIIRIVLSGYSDQNNANDSISVAHQYLSKPSSPATIIDVIKRAEGFHDAFDLEAQSAIASISTLPSPPEVLMEWKYALAQGGDIERLEEIATSDVALGAKILQLANSSFLREVGDKEIVSIPTAISWLGVSTLQELHERGYLIHRRSARSPIDITMSTSASIQDATANPEIAISAQLLQALGSLVVSDELDEMSTPPSPAKTGHWLMTLWAIPAAIIDAVDEIHENVNAHQP